MASNGFTPTQRKMLEVLSDGMTHTRAELRACLYDEMAVESALSVHLVYLREKLRPLGQDIIYRGGMYRHVRLTSIAE